MLFLSFHLAGLSHTSKISLRHKKGTLYFLHQDPPPQIMGGICPTSHVTQQATTIAQDCICGQLGICDAIDCH